MKLTRFIFSIVAMVGLASIFTAHAQDSEVPWNFHLKAVPEPADPDPATQTVAARQKTLGKRIAEALATLEKEDYRVFFSAYVDPFILAHAAAQRKVSVDEAFSTGIVGKPENTAEMARDFKASLSRSLKTEPRWLLNGRAASFIEDGRGRSAEFWIYFDGKWRVRFGG